MAVVVFRLVPVIVIVAPVPALEGVNEVIQGISLIKVLSLAEQPSAFVTVTLYSPVDVVVIDCDMPPELH